MKEMTKSEITGTEDFMAAASVVMEQAAANPGLGIPVDPDVAEFMGASDDGELPQEALDEMEGSHE